MQKYVSTTGRGRHATTINGKLLLYMSSNLLIEEVDQRCCFKMFRVISAQSITEQGRPPCNANEVGKYAPSPINQHK